MMEEYVMLKPERMEQIEERAEGLLTAYRYRPEVNDYVEIVEFARWRGFEIGNSRLPRTEDGFIIIQPDNAAGNGNTLGPRTIAVNVDRSVPFKRFIIAHELGHAALHWKGEELYLHRDSERLKTPEEQEQEEEADYFASALLMPRKSLRHWFNRLKRDDLSLDDICGRLSRIYSVPEKTVLSRLKELKLVA